MKNPLLKRKYAVAVARIKNGIDFTELNYTVIKNGINYWVADPFPIEWNGTLYIFGEVFEYSKNKGSIGYTKLENSKFTPWKIVIEEEYHLSFPNIFSVGNELFICPEANESNSIYLYKCDHFPDIWKKEKVIVKGGKYVDTVFYLQNEEKYGITFDVNEKSGKLTIFQADGTGEFSDISVRNSSADYARPAGKIYKDSRSGVEILPTQIGVPTYGAGLVLNEFQICWPNMELKPSRKIYPKDFHFDIARDYAGVHTLNFTEHYVVVDVKWYGINVVNLLFKAVRKIRRNNKYDGKR